MKVFRAYIKIIQKNLLLISINMLVFIGLSAAMSSSLNNNEGMNQYQSEKMKVAIINHDKNGDISSALCDYIDKNADVVEILETKEGIQDALFNRVAEYVITIPEGFSSDLLAGKDVKLDKMEIAGSFSGVYMDHMVDQFLNTVRIYSSQLGDQESLETLVDRVELDLKQSVSVEFNHENTSAGESNSIKYYFNFAVYSTMATAILGICTLVGTFNIKDIRRRNLVSPMKPMTLNLIQIAGNSLFMLVIWIVNLMVGFAIAGKTMLELKSMMMAANLFVVSFVALTMGFLVSVLIKSKNGQSAVANTVSLGFSFISGVFVPLELLGKSVKIIASFTPTYWYVKVNNEIANLAHYAPDDMKNIFYWIGIEILFGVAFLTLAMIISKQKSLGEKA